MDCVGIDFGGSVTDVVVRRGDTEAWGAFPAVEVPAESDVVRLVTEVAGKGFAPGLVAVTGGRSAGLATASSSLPISPVDETEAAAAGALRSGAPAPAVVLTLGTGTGMVLARPPEPAMRLLGSGVGGGTLLGLARLLLGTADFREIGRLAAAGDPARCDLTVGDILGDGIGGIPAHATAAHFGRVARLDEKHRPEDVAAALLGLVAQNSMRLVLDAAALHAAQSVVLVGHLLDVPGFHDVLASMSGFASGYFVVPDRPGFAVAEGALDVALGREAGTSL